MRVAVVAPPFGDTGGPEVATQNLVNALVELGVDVTIFAPADWKTRARLVPTLEKSLWSMSGLSSEERKKLRIESQLKVLDYEDDFELIHLNSQKYAHLVAQKSKKPCLLTLHNRIKDEQFGKIIKAGLFTVALSETHKKNFPVTAVIENGIDVKSITPDFGTGNYLITAGRITEPKGVDRAIEIARKTDNALLIYGRRGSRKKRDDYFKERIEPFLDENIKYLGQVSQKELLEKIAGAKAMLLPIRPVSKKSLAVTPLLAMESLAAGTPVICAIIEPTPEPLKDNRVAILSNKDVDMVRAVNEVNRFDRRICRKYAEEFFDIRICAKKYLKLYQRIIGIN